MLADEQPFTLGSLNSSSDFFIGSNPDSSKSFGGDIGEVRFYKRALTPADIADHYAGWYQQQCSISLAFAYPAGQQNLTAAYNAGLRIRKLLPETMLSMPFDINESSDAAGAITDYSRFLGDGTKSGATWTANGKVGGAYSFKNSGDRITLPSSLITGSGDFTVAAWVYPTALSPNDFQCVLCNGNNAESMANKQGILFGLHTSKPSLCQFNSMVCVDSNVSAITRQWTHIAAVQESGRVTIYMNGVQKGSGHGFDISTSAPLTIGNTPDDVSTTGYGFGGTIDEVRAFSRALTADEVLSLYNDNALASSQSLPLSQK